MIYILYRMMGKWYIDSVENWRKLTCWLESYEEDIQDIYISSNVNEIYDRHKEVVMS